MWYNYGKIVITIPVDSQSGFMILQSGDAKVPTEEAAPLLLMR